MPDTAATATRRWVEAQPAPPEPLRTVMLGVLGSDADESVSAVASGERPPGSADAIVVETLITAAAACLERAARAAADARPPGSATNARSEQPHEHRDRTLAAAAPFRAGAADLLLADAFVTYGVAAAAEAGMPMDDVLDRVRQLSLQQMEATK